MVSEKTTPPTSGHGLLRLGAFAILGFLAARRFTSSNELLVAGAVFGAIAGVVLLSPVRWLLWIANADVRKTHGYGGIRRAVGAGFATIVPFAVLAWVAEMMLGWDALTAFSMAGFMAAAGAAGVEVARLGGRPILNLVLSVLSGLGLVMLWLVFMMAVQAHVVG